MSLIQVSRALQLPDRSLRFGAAVSDRVDIGTSSSLDDLQPATLVMLAYFNQTPADGNTLFFKGLTGENGRWSAIFITSASGMTVSTQRRRVTTSSNSKALLSEFRAWGLNKWVWLAFQADTGTAGNNKSLIGDFENPFREPAAYDTQSNGSGTVTSNAGGTAWWGNNSDLTASLAAGSRIAAGWAFNRLLSINELELIRTTGRVPAGARLSMMLGDSGVASQQDLSGNGNNGTVTGASVDAGPAQAYTILNISGRERAVSVPPLISAPLGALELLRRRKNRIRGNG